MEILFTKSITRKDGTVETMMLIEHEEHLWAIRKTDASAIVSEDYHLRYSYYVDEWIANSNKDIDIIEAIKEHLGLPNNCRSIDEDFYFNHP